STSHFDSIKDVILLDGDTIFLPAKTYNEKITINKNNITVLGNNKEVPIDSTNRKEETIIADTITISGNVKNIKIDGVKLTGTQGIVLTDSQEGISIENTIFDYSGNYGIIDQPSSGTNYTTLHHDDISIDNCSFNSSNSNYSNDIYFQGYAGNINITNSKFINALNTCNESDFAIKLDRLTDAKTVILKNNTFTHLGANYVIDLGSEMTDEKNNAFISVENNFIGSEDDFVYGNGIGVFNLGSKALVAIKHNTIKNSTYYNGMLLSVENASNSNDGSTPKVDIAYNIFESVLNQSKPSNRKEATTNYFRLGLGIPEGFVTLDKNYFVKGTGKSGYAYTTNLDTATTKNVNPISIGTNSTDSLNTANDAYTSYLNSFNSFGNDINNYLSIINGIGESVIAYFGGIQENDILNYVPSFNEEYATKLSIKNGKLVYSGTDINLMYIAKGFGVEYDKSGIKLSAEPLKNLALQYYYQHTEINYDMNNNRRTMYASPEDATDYRNIYLDCSSFVNTVLYRTFGRDLILTNDTYPKQSTIYFDRYAQNNKPTSYNPDNFVLYYVETKDYTTQADKDNLLAEIRSNLQIGDIICYRHGKGTPSGGHIMMYIGDYNGVDTFIHCTGSSFYIDTASGDPSKAEDRNTEIEMTEGAILLMNTDNVFLSDSDTPNRYLFNDGEKTDGDHTTSFEVFRPTNLPNIKYTDEAKARATIPYLEFEKSSSINHMSSIVKGENITYTITITNHGTESLYNLNVTNYLRKDADSPQYVTFVDSDTFTLNDYTLSYILPEIKPNETITLSYNVKVNDTALPGNLIESSGNINGVLMNPIRIYVEQEIDRETLKTYALSLIEPEQKYEKPCDMVKEIYSSIDFKYDETTDLSKYFTESESQLYNLIYVNKTYTLNNAHKLRPILLDDLYGGTWIGFNDTNTIRLVTPEYLKTGDIILTRYDDKNKNKIYDWFVYIDETHILKQVKNSDGKYDVVNVITPEFTAEKCLSQLIAYLGYAVLRPSIG
ncbi:MAG: DUF11 domain-containing protein, partial [Firmicutes bacterium]|nr:DUF11 domain-containing protein [Candidatus Caballimonas caccae]